MSKPDRKILLLIGSPGVGKTTYAREFLKETESPEEWVLISGDDYIEKQRPIVEAEEGRELDSSAIVKKCRQKIKDAIAIDFNSAVTEGKSIILDFVHATEDSRTKLVKVAKKSEAFNYSVEAIIFNPPNEEEHIDKLRKRMSSKLFGAILNGELKTIQPLTRAESMLYDKVTYYGEKAQKPLNYEYDLPSKNFIQDLLSGKKKPTEFDLRR